MLHPQVYTRLGDIVFVSFMHTGLELDFGILLPDPRYLSLSSKAVLGSYLRGTLFMNIQITW